MYRGGRPGRTGGGGGSGMLFILAFHALAQFAQREHKPPVTAGLILANVLLFYMPGKLQNFLPTMSEVCLCPHLVLKDWDAKRLFLSAFYHIDETHLIYNMLSLLWKGVRLEGSMGSLKFAKMVAVLLGLSHGLVVIVAKGLDTFADYPDALYSHCAVGFSAVLFALKVVLNWNSPSYTSVYGVLVPARHAAWAELVLVQMFVPGTSFLGHFCGILAGLLYVHAPQWFSGSGLVPAVYTRLSQIRSHLLWPVQFVFRPFFGWSRRTFGRGFVGSRNNQLGDGTSTSNRGVASAVWRCQICTYDNGIYQDNCEMCGASGPQRGNGSPSAPPWPSTPSTPSVEEMRRARLARFS